jgi:DNA-binding CsgD family transcriptional regulator
VVAPVVTRERDLRALAAIISEDRPDLPDGEGLSPSLLADLTGQIRCDVATFERFDSKRPGPWFMQRIPPMPGIRYRALDRSRWKHYWDCKPSSYPDRSGDLRSITKTSDFYSARQWHGTDIYASLYRPFGLEHELQLCLPEASLQAIRPGRTMRLCFLRGPGPDFSERDRAVLMLLRPHLYQAYLDAQRRRHPVPRLTPRQNDLLHLVAAGHTNTQIARRLGVTEGTVRTHLQNIYEKLNVSSRTAAVTRAFSGQVE